MLLFTSDRREGLSLLGGLVRGHVPKAGTTSNLAEGGALTVSLSILQGHAEGAKADFKQVLALEPQNRQAREELTAIQQMEQQLEVAAY